MHDKRRPHLIIPAIVVILVVLLAAFAFFGVEYYATSKVKAEIHKHIQEVGKHVRVEYDSLGVNWLAFTVTMKKVKLSKPPLTGAVTIDTISVRDLTSIGIRWLPTIVSFDNVVVANQDTKFTVRQLSTSFSLSRIPTKEEVEKDPLVFLANLLAGDLKLADLAFSDDKTQLEIKKFETNYAVHQGNHKNSGLSLNRLKLQREGLEVACDDFSLTASLDQQNVISQIAKHVEKFSVKFPPDLVASEKFFQVLTGLGYDRLAFNFDLKYDYQPKTKELSNIWDASVENMGRLKVDLSWSDFITPPVPLSGGLDKFLSFLEETSNAPKEASLRSIQAAYKDAGLTPRILKAEAQARGKSVEDFTEELVTNLNAVLLFLPLPAGIKEQLKSVNQFLKKPNELQLAVTFKKPLSLKQLGQESPDRLLTLLDDTEVKISAK